MTDMSQGDAPIAATPNSSAPRATAPVDVPQRVYTQTDFRRYIAALGGLLALFGLIAAFAGHHFLVGGMFGDDPVSAEAGRSWMWVGIGSLIFGAAILVVQLFLTAYRRPAVE